MKRRKKDVGEFYEYVRGVKQDNIKALMWYMISLKNGFDNSKEFIEKLKKGETE